MSIKFDDSDLKKITDTFNDLKDINIVVKRTLNTTAKTAKVQTRKAIGKKLNLKAKRIGQDLTVTQASNKNWTSKVSCSSKQIGLINFASRQIKKGTKVKVYRQDQAKLYKHAFKENIKDKKHLWWRAKKRDIKQGAKTPKFSKNTGLVYRLPIVLLKGPATVDILDDKDVLNPLLKQASITLTENTDKEINKRLRALKYR